MSPQAKDKTDAAQPPAPRLYLAIDNCFASKRWTRPKEWSAIVADLGLKFIEASADTECDPLYSDGAYLEDWLGEVKAACRAAGVKVANFYSGHGTYATLGLGHTDGRCRRRMLEDWLKAMVRSASRLGAGLGFYCHAFPDAVLQNGQAYEDAQRRLYDALGELAGYAADRGLPRIGVEQMYTPHQVPWTIDGAKRLLREVLARGGHPFYLTIDTGHQTGQRKFLRPAPAQLRRAMAKFRRTGRVGGLWLGAQSAYECFRRSAAAPARRQAALLRKVQTEMDRCDHLFASGRDGDPYAWLENLGCYSPIIHLQQTYGSSSEHLPFTNAHSRRGKIRPAGVLRALAASYARPAEQGMPPRCEEIFLTLEIFSATNDTPAEIVERLEESVACWRRLVPTDGMELY
jgi:sugar phosphate isomerase/epimerase